ncbi:hypothetical protein NQZ79_g3640 [Umbelopsis isabellina]|nr:hypothetical protein NQZ79_g3640 [Umbelopsis isabellina]
MYFFIRQLSLLAAMVSIVSAGQLAVTGTFEIVSPTPQSIYVAGQMLPVIYVVNSDIVANKALDLSIFLNPAEPKLNITTMLITASADVGASPRVSKAPNGVFAFEHALNFNIPKDAPAGIYNVVFVDGVMQANTTVPVTIKAAASPSLAFTMGSSGTPATATNHINNQVNPAQPSSFLASSASHSTISIISTALFAAITSILFF